ncbi:MAG: sigma-54 dependent transcriptional regulator [Pirellulaceae bacterium]|nr:sigma-54 dependent transcriptional regulator [Pirellulaceae bacterium]
MSKKQDKNHLPAGMRVLVVDNEKAHAQVVAESLERIDYRCTVATSGPQGIQKIETEDFDLVVTDLMMNEVDGMAILQKAKQLLPNCEVIMITGHATVSRAVEAMQQGAFSFLEKPLKIDSLRAVVRKGAEGVLLKRENSDLTQRLDEKFGFEGIIYSSEKIEFLVERVKRIAPTDASALITGDSGTGKEMIAQAIHQNSPRKNKPFVAINCGAVAKDLVESELFGHKKGAFTHAHEDRVGKFEYANGGTLFLDEIGEMSLDVQVKLLRVLEERKITPVGENEPVGVNVRILSATNKPLKEAIQKGTFREDLYYRLNVVTLDIPPLAQRKEDIIPLVDHFRKMFVTRYEKPIKNISKEVFQKFLAYNWPGNIRQLRNFVEHMVVVDEDSILDSHDLPLELLDIEPTEIEPATASTAASGNGMADFIGQPLSKLERWAIEQTLAVNGGNREETAKQLGIGARTLYRKINEYQLSKDS